MAAPGRGRLARYLPSRLPGESQDPFRNVTGVPSFGQPLEGRKIAAACAAAVIARELSRSDPPHVEIGSGFRRSDEVFVNFILLKTCESDTGFVRGDEASRSYVSA